MKISNVTLGFVMLAGILLMSGCYKGWHRIEGNYNVQTETRQLPEFDRVVNSGEFDVYIIQDSLSEVTIEAESNLIPAIRTRVQGSSLIIDTQDNLRNHFAMKLYVHTTDLSEMSISGSGLMWTEDINTGDFDANISGSGNMFFSGNAADVRCTISGSGKIEMALECDMIEGNISGSGDMEFFGNGNKGDFVISGSGSIRAYDLMLNECYARISGSGSMYLTVENYLNVNISGSGNVYYMGNPIVESKITGSGSVIHP